MGWDIERRSRKNSTHLIASWSGTEPVYDAILLEGEGVARTSMGASSRAELHAYSRPLQGIFRWADDATAPCVILRWKSEPDGAELERVIALGG